MDNMGPGNAGRPPEGAQSGAKPTFASEQKIGGYVLLAKLGAGGIGEVWKARDTRLNRIVALKFISGPRPGSSPVRELLREARAASALNHPNIVTIFEVGEGTGAAYLAMEFVEGETLRERMKRAPVPAEEALEVAQQVAAGLAAAHRNGIVHRDLKPENIMLRADGLAKLMDFGLAKLVPWADKATASADSRVAASDSGSVVGTLTYMSPEQARGQPVTAASDVFSFGIVFYEMLTAEHPFRAETAVDTLTAILNREPTAVTEKSPAVPAAMSGIAARSLKKDASKRFPSGVELHEELMRVAATPFAAGLPTAANPHLTHKPRWMQAAGGALMALILGAAVWRVRFQSGGGAIGPTVRSVAVMNFHSDPGDPGALTLAQDLPEELSGALSKTGLQIASHESVLQLGPTTPPREVGAQLGVDAVLDGSVRTRGGSFKIHIELSSTSTGFQLWSETVTLDGQNALANEQKAAAEIAQDLRQAMAGGH